MPFSEVGWVESSSPTFKCVFGAEFCNTTVGLSRQPTWLASDAAERVVMIKAYVALAREGKLDDSHRSLILQALFKPSTTGLVKDDAVPASMLDLATRVAQAGSSKG